MEVLPEPPDEVRTTSWHVFPILALDRDTFIDGLTLGVGTDEPEIEEAA